jgi:hypothetical protein
VYIHIVPKKITTLDDYAHFTLSINIISEFSREIKFTSGMWKFYVVVPPLQTAHPRTRLTIFWLVDVKHGAVRRSVGMLIRPSPT